MSKEHISATVEKNIMNNLESTRTEITKEKLNNGRDPKTLPSKSEVVEKAIESSPLMDYELYKELKKEYKKFNNKELDNVNFGRFVRHKLKESLED